MFLPTATAIPHHRLVSPAAAQGWRQGDDMNVSADAISHRQDQHHHRSLKATRVKLKKFDDLNER